MKTTHKGGQSFQNKSMVTADCVLYIRAGQELQMSVCGGGVPHVQYAGALYTQLFVFVIVLFLCSLLFKSQHLTRFIMS